MSAYPDAAFVEDIGRRRFLRKSATLATAFFVISTLSGTAHAQTLAELLVQSNCVLPVYFPAEVFHVGRIMKVRSIIKVQVNNFTTQRARDDFLAMSQKEKDEIFPQKEPAHEFNSFGHEPFGASPADSYKGLEQSGKLFLFAYRGSREQLKEIMVEYRHVPEHGQVVKEEISALDYFNKTLNEIILPALQSCVKK